MDADDIRGGPRALWDDFLHSLPKFCERANSCVSSLNPGWRRDISNLYRQNFNANNRHLTDSARSTCRRSWRADCLPLPPPLRRFPPMPELQIP